MENLGLFLISAFVINLTPGPAMLFCLNQSINFGIKRGLFTVLGLELAITVYVIATAFGLAEVFKNFPYIYKAIQIIGIIYLLHLAYSSWPRRIIQRKTSSSNISPNDQLKLKVGGGFFKGFLINITNPKIVIFFIGLMPQFISDPTNNKFIFLVYGLIFNLGGILVNSTVVILAPKLIKYIKSDKKSWFSYVPPILFIIIVMNVLINLIKDL